MAAVMAAGLRQGGRAVVAKDRFRRWLAVTKGMAQRGQRLLRLDFKERAEGLGSLVGLALAVEVEVLGRQLAVQRQIACRGGGLNSESIDQVLSPHRTEEPRT